MKNKFLIVLCLLFSIGAIIFSVILIFKNKSNEEVTKVAEGIKGKTQKSGKVSSPGQGDTRQEEGDRIGTEETQLIAE